MTRTKNNPPGKLEVPGGPNPGPNQTGPEPLRDENRLRVLSSLALSIQENERKRISRELHDGVCQTLVALKIQMENELAGLSGKVPDHELMSFREIISRLQGAIAEVRAIIMDLRPSVLDDFGLVAAIHWFCREFPAGHEKIHIETDIAIEEEHIPESQKTVLFRVIQEAMNNIARHSHADWARVALKKDQDFLELTVEDNGVGFNPGQGPVQGVGLKGMKERVEIASGGLYIESGEGSGTRVRAVLPCRDSTTRDLQFG